MTVKSVEQQGVLALHAARALLVKQQTMLANALRGLAAEFGLMVPQGFCKLEALMELVDTQDQTDLPEAARQGLRAPHRRFCALEEEAMTLGNAVVAHARQDDTARRLATIPGVDHHLLDRSHRGQHRLVQEYAALRSLAGLGAAPAFHGRQGTPGPHHQGGQRRHPHLARPRGDIDGLPGRAVKQSGRSMAVRRAWTSANTAGHRGAGQQDGAHRLGADDAQGRFPPGRSRCCGRSP